jgi:ribosomal protein L7/L12
MLEIRALLQARNKIAAIKLYRAKTGASLSQAKAAIDELDAYTRYGH